MVPNTICSVGKIYFDELLELLQRGVLRFMVELFDELVAIFHQKYHGAGCLPDPNALALMGCYILEPCLAILPAVRYSGGRGM
jgi:hypothetical protein